jgi:hypothetical protein
VAKWFLLLVSSRRYSVIGFCQSASGLGVQSTATTSPSGPGLGAIVSAEVPRLASGVGVGPFSPVVVPGTGTEVF